MKVRFWKQHSMETCGAACTLMALDAFGIDFPTVGKEMALYRMYRSRCMPGMQGGAVALALVRRGLAVTLFHASPNMVDNQDGYYPPELHAAILEEHREAVNRAGQALTLRVGQPVTPAFLRAELARERLAIVEILVPGDADGMHDQVLHGVLLYGTDGPDFLACDPLRGRIRLSEQALASAMDTPAGTMAIIVGKGEAEA